MDERLKAREGNVRAAERVFALAHDALCAARRGCCEDPWKEVPCQEVVKRCISVAGVRGIPVVLWGPEGGFQEMLAEGAARMGVACVLLRTCACGNYTDPRRACRCKAGVIEKHWAREVKRAPKGALWCEVCGVPAAEVTRVRQGRHGTTTAQALAVQEAARANERPQGGLVMDCEKLLELAIREGVARAEQAGWFIEVARDIAQLGGCAFVDASCVAEALHYRERRT